MRSSSIATNLLLSALLALVSTFGVSCAAKTQLSSQWLSPDYTAGAMHKFIVVGVAKTDAVRRTYEDRLAQALMEMGAEAVPSYQLLPSGDRLGKEALEGAVRQNGFEGVILTRLLEVSEETVYVPPTREIVPSIGYGGYGYYGQYHRSFDVIHTPGYTRSTTIVRLETRLWNAADSQLVWSVTSDTFNPKSTDDTTASVTKRLVQKLASDGLLAK